MLGIRKRTIGSRFAGAWGAERLELRQVRFELLSIGGTGVFLEEGFVEQARAAARAHERLANFFPRGPLVVLFEHARVEERVGDELQRGSEEVPGHAVGALHRLGGEEIFGARSGFFSSLGLRPLDVFVLSEAADVRALAPRGFHRAGGEECLVRNMLLVSKASLALRRPGIHVHIVLRETLEFFVNHSVLILAPDSTRYYHLLASVS
mmetsp:Transcript_24883/g.47211  ORF Transcript_24883/g.47211 Transcript_24883/m.47211 type:complete len:208 (+) Transcript_24883:398-1021(+)